VGTGLSFGASATTNQVVCNLAITGVFTASDPTISSNASGTKMTASFPAKAVKISSKDVLNLLKTEFATNFPSGAQLAIKVSGDSGFVVVDNRGNLILDVSTNAADSEYRFDLTNAFDAEPLITGKMTETKTSTTTNMAENVTVYMRDMALYYADGYGNDFHFSGVAVMNASVYSDETTDLPEAKSLSMVLTGSGGGIFYDPADADYVEGVFTKATWKASGKNILGFDF